MTDVIDPEFDEVVLIFENAVLSDSYATPRFNHTQEYADALMALHKYLRDKVLAERQLCANIARTVGDKHHENHRYAECDFSDTCGERIADAILEQ